MGSRTSLVGTLYVLVDDVVGIKGTAGVSVGSGAPGNLIDCVKVRVPPGTGTGTVGLATCVVLIGSTAFVLVSSAGGDGGMG